MVVASEDSNIGSNVKVPYVNGLVICAFLSIAWYSKSQVLSRPMSFTSFRQLVYDIAYTVLWTTSISESRDLERTNDPFVNTG
jgi:hypothetical protein